MFVDTSDEQPSYIARAAGHFVEQVEQQGDELVDLPARPRGERSMPQIGSADALLARCIGLRHHRSTRRVYLSSLSLEILAVW